jgi:hypothetical protein
MKKQLLSLLLLGAGFILKAQNPYPIIALDTVQFVNNAKLSLPVPNDTMDYISPVFKDSVYRDTFRFEGIVATNPKIYGLSTNRKAAYIQRKGGGPWSGVLVMCEPSGTGLTLANFLTETKFYDNFVVGYKVRVTGVARTFNGTNPPLKQGETQINLIRNNTNWDNSVEQVDLVKDTLVYSEIEAKDLQTGNPNTNWQQQRLTGEKWEGVLVKIKNVSVYSIQISGNRTFWSVIDDFGNVLDVRDFSGYYRRDDNEDTVPKIANTFQAPPIGTRLEYIQGIVTEYQVGAISRYGICPIYPTDYKICSSCPPIAKFINRNPVIAKTTDPLNITYEITVGDTTLRAQMLYYKKPGSSTLDSVSMTAVPSFPNYYVGTINPVGTEGVMSFWVRAEDKRGRQTFSPDPLTLGNQIYVTTNGVNSVQLLQFSNNNTGSSVWAGDSLLNISVPAVVTGISYPSMITVQAGTGPNSAIFIQKGTNGTVNNWRIGDSVLITRATVGETFNTTNLYNILGSVIDSNRALPAMATNLSLDSFAQNRVSYARQYEGVLMRFDSVKVNSVNPDAPTGDFGEFAVINQHSSATTGLRIDDLSTSFKGLSKMVKAGMIIGYIQGPMYFANGSFKMIPRTFDDADLSKIDSVAPVLTLLGENPDTVIKGSGTYVDAGATATDNIDGDISSHVVVSGTVNTDAVGMYVLNYKVSDNWGNMDSAMRTVIVIDTTHVGLNENEMNFAQLSVYPNPANEQITISAKYIKTVPVTVTIVDMLGRTVETRNYTKPEFTDVINTANFSNGVYFCTISNASGSKTLKFMVSGK